MRHCALLSAAACSLIAAAPTLAQAEPDVTPPRIILLTAARLIEIDTGHIVAPARVLIEGQRIVAVGPSLEYPPNVQHLEDRTLLPGLIDAHVHLFLHPGAEDLQTVEEAVPLRTLLAIEAARADLQAGFTAERDMGTEGAGSADSAVRDAIDRGLFPGPRLRVSGNAIDILGGHEDAIRFNPSMHIASNASYANSRDQLVTVIRQQHKEGSDFVKIYETGRDEMRDGNLYTPFQFTEAQLRVAVEEAARLGTVVAVHAMGEPGTLFAARAGVASIDHATQLSDETMRLMKAKHIPAVPTFAVFEYFAERAGNAEQAQREQSLLDYKVSEFKKQIAFGIDFAVGSDVEPFPHGTQAREMALMVGYGLSPLRVLQADLINGARLLGWSGPVGQIKQGYYADIIAVKGNPLEDITALQRVDFVMKGGDVVRAPISGQGVR